MALPSIPRMERWREHWPSRMMWKPCNSYPSLVSNSPAVAFFKVMRFRHSRSSRPLNLCLLYNILGFNIYRMTRKSCSFFCSLLFESDLIS